MSIPITFYSFSKRINSTLRPSASTLQKTYDCVFKTPVSQQSPVLEVYDDQDSLLDWNYCSFNNMYYFIDDMTSMQHNMWQVTCTKDVMASFKENILITSAFVKYSASDFDSNITDQRIAWSNTPQITTTTTRMQPLNGVVGTYMVTVLGARFGSAFENGFTTTYAMSGATLERLVSYLVTSQTLQEELEKIVNSVYDTIISCMWLPVNSGAISTTTTNVFLGSVDTGIPAQMVSSSDIGNTYTTFAIPWYFQDSDGGIEDFRNASPFTTATMYIPMIGLVDIDMSQFYRARTIVVEYNIDVMAGDMVVRIRRETQNGTITQTFSAGIGTNMSIGQITRETIGMLAGVGSAVTGVLTGNPLLVVGGAAEAVQSAATHGNNINGVYGGRASARLSVDIVFNLFSNISSAPPSTLASVIGRPLFARRTLSSLRGYVQCTNASVLASATTTELMQINNYLNGGAFIE